MLNQKPVSKIWVFTHKAAFMQRVADYVRTGHQAYIQGLTALEKMHSTWDRLAMAHPVFDDKLKAFRARLEGHPTGRLLLYQNQQYPDKIHWILLIHGRVDQLTPGEKWRHAEDPHNRILFTGYELIRVTKEGLKKPVWTWRYSTQRYEDLRDSMVMAIRSRRDQDLKQLIDSVSGTVGFSGSREQAKKLISLLKSEWQLRRKDDPMPDVPPGFGWVRRKADKGVFLTRPKGAPPAKKDRPIDPSMSPETARNEMMEGVSVDSFLSLVRADIDREN